MEDTSQPPVPQRSTSSHGNDNDTTPLNTTFQHRHPQPAPTPTAEGSDDPFGIRRIPSPRRSEAHPKPFRDATSNGSGEGMVRIAIATPFNDIGGSRRKEGLPVERNTNIEQLKNDIAEGKWEENGDTWEREGMRLVWQGRVIRDQETVGHVIGYRDVNQVHTFHLVARRKAGSSRTTQPTMSLPDPVHPTATSDPVLNPTPTASGPSVPFNRNEQAYNDVIHYLLFRCRYYLCHLLGVKALEWHEMVPAPIIDEATAKDAVLSVLYALRQTVVSPPSDLEKQKIERTIKFDEKGIWEEGGRIGVEAKIKLLWFKTVAREWQDGPAGESVAVELDGLTYRLNLPPLSEMAPSQLVYLQEYLQNVHLLSKASQQIDLLRARASPSVPILQTTTVRVEPAARQRNVYSLSIRIPLHLIGHILFSGVKIGAMIWMFTQGMKWDDIKLWIIGGGAIGWWLGDTLNQIRVERARQRRVQEQERQRVEAEARVNDPNPPPDAQGGPAGQRNAAPNPELPDLMRAAARTNRRRRDRSLKDVIPLIHLNTDSEQLQIHGRTRRGAIRPPKWLTQFLLPVALWFITLIPEWESMRARAIRRRERQMRVLVGEMSTAPSPVQATTDLPDTGEPEAVQGIRRRYRNSLGLDAENGEGENADAQRRLPEGLNDAAKRYYERVIERGEGIDWEEEREAQRAMGIGEENDGDQGGMRMGVL